MPKSWSISGLTLVEILVAVTIVSLVAVIGIPNLKKFNSNQELDNTSSELIRVLRIAQSSAMSGVRCATEPSKTWEVSLNHVSPASYQTFCVGEATEDVLENKEFKTPITLYTTSCPSSLDKVDIIFQRNNILFKCQNEDRIVNKFVITLRDTSRNQNRDITIDRGGAIY